jgi:hypothetical protein
MKDIEYEELLKKLDLAKEKLSGNISIAPHPSTQILERQNSVSPINIINKDVEVERLSTNEKLLSHTMLHFLYSNGGAKNLSIKDIEQLHLKISKALPNHKYFDSLDKEII